MQHPLIFGLWLVWLYLLMRCSRRDLRSDKGIAQAFYRGNGFITYLRPIRAESLQLLINALRLGFPSNQVENPPSYCELIVLRNIGKRHDNKRSRHRKK